MRSIVLAALLVAGCSPVEPPVVEASPLSDTTDTRGPYPVTARVRTRRELRSVELVWHNAAVSPTSAVRVRMPRDEAGLYHASIPGHGAGAVVAFHVEAVDEEYDRGYDPPESAAKTGCAAERCFNVIGR